MKPFVLICPKCDNRLFMDIDELQDQIAEFLEEQQNADSGEQK